MDDLQKLKRSTCLEELIEETGYLLDHKPGERYWTCLQYPDLRVDLRKQRYYWDSQNEQGGDAIDWLVHRFDWPVSRAIKYLSARLEMPAEQRPRFLPVESQGEPEKPIVDISEPGASGSLPAGVYSAADRRTREAIRLARDIPGGIEKYLGLGWWQIIEQQRWIPKLFIQLIGMVEEADDHCSFCLEDLEGWKERGAYLGIQKVDDSYSLTYDGVYCGRCVSNFRRWLRALELLASVKAGERQGERGAGEGETTQVITPFSILEP